MNKSNFKAKGPGTPGSGSAPDKSFFQLKVSGSTAELDIYGDITSWPWLESDVSAYLLSRQLSELDPDVTLINVNINSYGGEVAEGLAIYNALKRHPAQVRTRVDGFACSIASVVFMAGDERYMNDASLLMVHNAWTRGSGDAAQLRKLADDIETITQASKAAYLSRVSITEEELTALMDEESWIVPDDALSFGFATAIETPSGDGLPSQCARRAAFQAICGAAASMAQEDDPDEEDPEGEDPEPGLDDPCGDDETDDDPDGEDDAGDSDETDGEDDEADDEDDPDDADEDGNDTKSEQRAAFAAFLSNLTT